MKLFRFFETSMIASTVVMALIIMSKIDFNLFFIIYTAIWFSGAAISAWNDSFDVVEDTISHPNRPIPSGFISIKNARIIGTIFAILSLVITSIISLSAVMIIIVSLTIGILYSVTTKRFLLMKNLTVMISGIIVLYSLVIIFGEEITILYYIFMISITLLLFSYEILKDLHDIEGDKAAGIMTLPIKFSPKNSAIFSTSLFILSCILMSIGFALEQLYPEMIISGATAFLIIFPAKALVDNPNPKNSEKMRIVIISIILGSLSIIAVLGIIRGY